MGLVFYCCNCLLRRFIVMAYQMVVHDIVDRNGNCGGYDIVMDRNVWSCTRTIMTAELQIFTVHLKHENSLQLKVVRIGL